jgi:hypothetical protein
MLNGGSGRIVLINVTRGRSLPPHRPDPATICHVQGAEDHAIDQFLQLRSRAWSS